MIKEKLDLDKDLKLFAEELKSCFSKDELERIARDTGFVKRKGKVDAWEFVYLCCFMNAEVADNTLVSLCTKLSSKLGLSISSQALDQRLNEDCVSFLKRIFKSLLKKRSEKSAKNAKKKGLKKRASTIELLGVSLYITNINKDVLDAEQVHEFYALRWQVEIVFKTWKSIFKIHRIKPVKLARFQCQLYGKLIQVLICSSLMFKMRKVAFKAKGLEASEIKVCEIVCEYIERLYFELISFPENIPRTLNLIFGNVVKNGLKSHRKSSRTVFDILGICCKQTLAKSELVA